MKKTAVAAASVAILALAWTKLTPAAAAPPKAAPAGAKTYAATVYVAGDGGHFAKADVVVDPSDAENPIKVKALDQVTIGTSKSHKNHDARIDGGTMYWATYALDQNGKIHKGKTDLGTGTVVQDVAFDPDPRAPLKAGPGYCGSGQTKSSFLPVFMGNEGYVDVLDKKTLDLKHRLFVSDLGYKAGSYQFVHGTSSHDGKRFIVTVTMKGGDGKMNGKQDVVMLDLPALEQGRFKELARTTLTGEPVKTIAFRQYFTTDDKLVYQSAGDRMWVLDAATLKLVDEKMTTGLGENHDVEPTPDGKYAVLTIRTTSTPARDEKGNVVPDKQLVDGALLLYDATAKRLVGKPASICYGCHKDAGKVGQAAIICGLAMDFRK